MTTTIQYRIKNVYGNDRLYIVDPQIAGDINLLTRRTTIDQCDIEALTRLGFTFERVF